jgi:hypothetical protein
MPVAKFDTLEGFLKVFCDGPEPFPVDVEQLGMNQDEAPQGVVYRGSALRMDIHGEFDGYGVGQVLPDGVTEVGEWGSAPFRFVWVSRELRAIVTYCEHDINVTVDSTPEAFDLRMARAAEFYVGSRQ